MEIETADLPLPVRAKILGNEIKDGVLIEKATDVPPHIALGFKSLKSNGKYRYVWLLKGVAQPMAEDYSTKKDNVEHKTPKVKFTFALVKNHPFVDGNKRIRTLAMVVFLDINGIKVECTDDEIIELGFGLARGTVTEKDLLKWIIEHS